MFIALLTALILLKNSLEHLNKRRGNYKEVLIKQIAATETTSQVNKEHKKVSKIVNKMSTTQNQQQQQQQKQQATAKSASASSRSGSGSGSAGDSAKVDANEFSKNVLVFNNTGEQNSCLEIGGKDVHIVGSAGSHDHGSSKVKLKNIVDYKWENKHYPGHLIAVHMDSNHIAYVIVNNKANRMEGMVRVAKLSFGLRALIKGMSGEVLDIQFAHIERERILASIDATALYVHKIEMQCGLLVCNLIVKIDDPIKNYTPKFDKVCWCPFEQDDEDDEDSDDSKLIVWARGSRFQCLNIRTVVNDHGKGVVTVDKLSNGYMLFKDDALTITWINLSPDGTTLSVGSTDGFIRFYQVYMFDKEWRCLHQWKPHNGKPISSFFFLDNLNNKNKAEAYWKYAITCANNNTELKLWDCGTWSCMQTVTIGIKTESTQPLRFIADINRSAEYMVLTCLETRSCYVFQIDNDTTSQNDSAKKTKGSGKKVVKKIPQEPETPVLIKSVAEFPLSSGVLSFSIMDAAVRRYKCGNDSYLCEELDDYDEENNSVVCVVVRIIIVQPKSLQECRILYQPSVAEHTELGSTLSESINSIAAPTDTTQSTNSNESTDSVDEGGNKDVKSIETQIKKLNPLEVLLGITTSSANTTATATTTTPNDAANNELQSQPAAGKLPIIQESVESGNASPLAGSNSGNTTNSKAYGSGQVNLMTPDSFTTKSPPDTVSTEVLNTILMLANATKQATPNNKIIEDTLEMLEAQQSFKAIDQNPNSNTGENIASGGSSPSREVQEIMSLQDYDKSSSSCDDEELLDEQITTKTDEVLAASVDENDQSAGGKAANKSWPKVPEAPKTSTTKHSAELQNAANLISQAVNASGGANSHVPPSLGSNASNSNSNIAINGSADLADVNLKLNELIDLVKHQSVQINSLQSEISELKKNNTEFQGSKPFKEFGFKLEVQLSKLLEQYLKRYENEHNKRLAAFMNGRDVQNRELRDCFVQITNQFILTQMGDLMSKVVNIEIQRNLAPMLNAKIDHLQQQIHLDITQKLNAFDLMLKENIGSACKNKTVIDAFGKSVLVGVQGSLQAAFIESMSSTLIPAYEKSSQNMFKQLHDAFSVGIKEFMEQFDGYMNHMRPQQETSDEILNNFNGFRQHVDTILNNQRGSINELMCEVRKDVKSLEILLTRQVQEIVRSEIRKGFDHQTVALRSQANTPAPTYDLREAIKHLLAQGQINKAFHQALLANDLNLVEFTLKHADHNTVFTPECVLEQKVLLSLMQQISADMSNHDEIKQSYLADALLAININDPITREHAPKVLNEMYRNCQMFLINFPKNSQCSNVRMLLKAVQSFNKDTF